VLNGTENKFSITKSTSRLAKGNATIIITVSFTSAAEKNQLTAAHIGLKLSSVTFSEMRRIIANNHLEFQKLWQNDTSQNKYNT